MKNICLVLVLFCIIAFPSKAQTTPKSEEQQIQQIVANVFEGFSAFDVN